MSDVPVPQRLAIVVPTNAAFDSRTTRLATSLASRGHGVSILARGGDGHSSVEDTADGVRIIRAGRHATSRLPAPLRIADRALATRSQMRGARRAGIRADAWHAMGFMALPVALDLARRSGAPTVYDARDLYADARSLARLPGFARAIV